jgi:hypothetical protein
MPRIQMTPLVRITLSSLCVYVIVLLALIGVKFMRDFAALRAAAPAAVESPEPPAGSK